MREITAAGGNIPGFFCGLCRSPLIRPRLCSATFPQGKAFSAGKRYASMVDDEKTAFESGTNTRQYGHKKPATSIIAVFTDMDGQRRLWIDTKFLDFCVLAVYNSIRQPV
jgi:hypothetical protein